MRIAVYVISLAILTLAVPAPHLVVEKPFNLTPLIPAAGNQSGGVAIGNNYSRSSFLLTSNLSSVNESIWILNCNVTYQGNVLINASGGSINIVNSTISPISIVNRSPSIQTFPDGKLHKHYLHRTHTDLQSRDIVCTQTSRPFDLDMFDENRIIGCVQSPFS